MILEIKIDAPISSIQEIKECLAMHLELFGKVNVISVKDDQEQLKMKEDL